MSALSGGGGLPETYRELSPENRNIPEQARGYSAI